MSPLQTIGKFLLTLPISFLFQNPMRGSLMRTPSRRRCNETDRVSAVCEDAEQEGLLESAVEAGQAGHQQAAAGAVVDAAVERRLRRTWPHSGRNGAENGQLKASTGSVVLCSRRTILCSRRKKFQENHFMKSFCEKYPPKITVKCPNENVIEN